jgi:hypothetical protein
VRSVATDAVLDLMEKHLFIRASELLANINIATKDLKGFVTWINLSGQYHSTLIKTVDALRATHKSTISRDLWKETLFFYLLRLLNGSPHGEDFFSRQKIETQVNRENRERKRLARKRQRAAKREREREEPKVRKTGTIGTTVSNGTTRSCKRCGTKFTSRKRASKHSCDGKRPEKVAPPPKNPAVSDSKRARRAKNRKARSERKKASKISASTTSAIQVRKEALIDNKLVSTPPVTVGSVIDVVKTIPPSQDSKPIASTSRLPPAPPPVVIPLAPMTRLDSPPSEDEDNEDEEDDVEYPNGEVIKCEGNFAPCGEPAVGYKDHGKYSRYPKCRKHEAFSNWVEGFDGYYSD